MFYLTWDFWVEILYLFAAWNEWRDVLFSGYANMGKFYIKIDQILIYTTLVANCMSKIWKLKFNK